MPWLRGSQHACPGSAACVPVRWRLQVRGGWRRRGWSCVGLPRSCAWGSGLCGFLSTLGWLGACSCVVFCSSSHLQDLPALPAQPTQSERPALSCQPPRPAVCCPQAHAQRVQPQRRVDAGWRLAPGTHAVWGSQRGRRAGARGGAGGHAKLHPGAAPPLLLSLLLRDGACRGGAWPSRRAASFGPAPACCPLLPHHRVPCCGATHLPACLPAVPCLPPHLSLPASHPTSRKRLGCRARCRSCKSSGRPSSIIWTASSASRPASPSRSGCWFTHTHTHTQSCPPAAR